MREAKGFATKALAVAVLTALTGMANAGVVTDGSMGAAQTLSGPNFAVAPNLGQQRGGNLFHSFSQFNLSVGQSATFSGPPQVQNVLARVTAGGASQIDGAIRCTIPNANFYLMNPSGVVFGPNATLDVKGSFAVTTASVIQLKDGGRFNAVTPSDTVLTTAAPGAFGFLSSTLAPITMNGPLLAVPPGKALSVLGGNLHIAGTELDAPGGRINLIGVGSAGTLTLDAADVHSATDVATFATRADIAVTDGSNLVADGNTAGQITIRGKNLDVHDSAIGAAGTGPGNGLGIDIDLSGKLDLANGAIFTDSFDTGRPGDIGITASAITLDSGGNTSQFSGISALAAGTGLRAGDIHIAADTLDIANAAAVMTDTKGPGDAGNVSVNVHALSIDGKNVNAFTGISATSQATPHGGKAGDIQIQADSIRATGGGQLNADTASDRPAGLVNVLAGSVTLDAGGIISASTFGPGQAGSVAISAGQLTIDSSGGGPISQIAANSITIGSGGDAGNVQIAAQALTIGGTGLISVDTAGRGNAGSLRVTADTISLDGRGVGPAGMSATSRALGNNLQSGQASQAGNAGTIDIAAGTMQLQRGVLITASTAGPGNGGHVSIVADSLQIDGANANAPTGLFASAGQLPEGNDGPPPGFTPSGSAGTITVRADSAQLLGGGAISATTFGMGNGGQIGVSAGDLLIDTRGASQFSGITADTKSPQAGGSAGAVNVEADNIQILAAGAISATAQGLGHGGNIHVAATGSLTIDGQGAQGSTGISADSTSTGAGGDAGSIHVEAGNLLIRDGGRIASNTSGQGAGGGVTVQAHDVTLDVATPGGLTGISAVSLASGAGGHGGNVTVVADTLSILGGTRISSETFGLGDGGRIDIFAESILLDSSTTQANGGIVADTRSSAAGGHGGAISIASNSLHITGGALVSSSTDGLGDSGNVTVNANNILIDRAGSSAFTGIAAESSNPGAGGKAGDITIAAKNLVVRGGSLINSNSEGAGAGGTVDIQANHLFVTGATADGGVSSIRASAEGLVPGGDGGSVTIRANRVSLSDRGLITTRTTGPNPAGSVTIDAASVHLSNRTSIDSAASNDAAGPAGSVTMNLSGDLTLDRSAILTSAPNSSGGNITLHVARNFLLHESTVSAEAAGEGGSISLYCSGPFDVRNSTILTQAGDNGGNILIDPPQVILENSRLSANGGDNGGNITLVADGLIQSNSIITATGATGINGDVLLTTPDTQLAGSLAVLSADFAPPNARLAPACGLYLTRGAISSFVISGQGGESPQPDGWTPAGVIDLRTTTQPAREPR